MPLMVTVDVEPDWGFGGTRALAEIVPRLIETFEPLGVRFTFFVVSDLLRAEGVDALGILREASRRHEIGSHGKTHTVLTELPAVKMAAEIADSRKELEDRLGVAVTGFRCPFLKRPPGLYARLQEAGYRYDSSGGTVWPALTNLSARHWRPSRESGIVCLPTTTLRGGVVPFSLTYLRLLHPLGRALVDARAPILYFHPHELLPPETARVVKAPLRILLRRNAGAAAWRILGQLLAQGQRSFLTCGEYVCQWNTRNPAGPCPPAPKLTAG